jgi:hypothetical protein
LAQRDIQNANATRTELDNAFRNSRQAQRSYDVAAAGAGVEGRSVDYLHAQFTRDVADFESTAARNIANFRTQSSMEAKAIYARGQSAINGGYPNPLPPTATVSPLTSLMNGMSTGLSAYSVLNGAMSTPSGVGTPPTGNAIDGASVPNYVSANPTTGTAFGAASIPSAGAPVNYFNAASYLPRK